MTTCLDHGLRLVSRRRPSPVCSLAILFPRGSWDDPPGLPGLLHVTEHWVFEGTEGLPEPGMVSLEVERLGGWIGGFTDRHCTALVGTCLAGDFPALVSTVHDLCVRPRLAGDRFSAVLGVVDRELAERYDDPSRLSRDLADLQVNGKQRSDLTAGMAPDAVDEARNAAWQLLQPRGAVVAVIGPGDERDLVADTFGSWHRAEEPLPVRPLSRPAGGMVRTRAEASSAYVTLVSPPLYEPTCVRAAETLAHALGRGLSSRLSRTLRDQLGLVYDVYCSVKLVRGGFYYRVHFSCAPDRVPVAQEQVRAILSGAVDLDRDELETADRARSRLLQVEFEAGAEEIVWLATRHSLYRDADWEEAYASPLASVQIQRAAEVLAAVEELATVVVSPDGD